MNAITRARDAIGKWRQVVVAWTKSIPKRIHAPRTTSSSLAAPSLSAALSGTTGHGVSFFIANFKQTGQGNSFACQLDAAIEWTDADGNYHSASDTLRFPSIMAGVPSDIIQEELTNLMLGAWRVKLGVDG